MKVYVDESEIHGSGIFAIEPIQEGETIITIEGYETDEIDEYTCFVIDKKVFNCTNEARFVNTSDSFNADFVGISLVATKNIGADEEITVKQYKSLYTS